MLSAPSLFMAVANATAAVVQTAPPYITYHVHATFRFDGEATADRTVTVRTDDGVSVVHDDLTGKDELRSPFPASPAFDALAEFTVRAEVTTGPGGARAGDMRISNVQPLHYEAVASHADAVAHGIKGYVVTVAADATPALGHLHFERNDTMHDAKKWLRDVWYDPATMLPTRVVWNAVNDVTLDSQYQIVAGHWLLRRIAITGIYHGPLWVARASVAVTGTYDGYTFSSVAPDPRLLPSPAPSPLPLASPSP
jgi:hypothetical protein